MVHKDCFPGPNLTCNNNETSSMANPIRQIRHCLSMNSTFEKKLGVRNKLKGERRQAVELVIHDQNSVSFVDPRHNAVEKRWRDLNRHSPDSSKFGGRIAPLDG